ncbi:MAG: hypothetical protein GY795_47820 [Desulfobacterales bacterium]|nr:hypothetical protein [Desulfobacterales bacterium]
MDSQRILFTFKSGLFNNTINQLCDNMAIVIEGFHRCGKSTFAEALDIHLKDKNINALLQSAEKWIQGRRCQHISQSEQSFDIDTEIDKAIELMLSKKGCWILDDGEIMLAHTSEKTLLRLGNALQKNQLRLILIRNRFVLDDYGWFHDRELLLNVPLPHLKMQPFDPTTAIEIATGMFHGQNRERRGEWLANWSGGIPGMMYDLHSFTPEWPYPDEITPHISEYAIKICNDLELHRPVRSSLIASLRLKILPPQRMLSHEAKVELGYLSLLGMVTSDRSENSVIFQGNLWNLVADTIASDTTQITEKISDQALNLEILLDNAEFCPYLCEDLDLPIEQGLLAEAFVQSIFCSVYMPRLVIPITDFLAESIGRIGLRLVLTSAGITPSPSSSGKELAGQLISHAGMNL